MTFQLVTTINDPETISDIVQDMDNLTPGEVVGRWAYLLDGPRKRSGIFMEELPDRTHSMRSEPYTLMLWDGMGTAALFIETMRPGL